MICESCFWLGRGSVEATADPVTCRGRISRHPSMLGAKIRPRRPRRWRVGTQPSIGRTSKPFTSCGCGRLRFLRLRPCPCRLRSAPARPCKGPAPRRPKTSAERVWRRTGDAEAGFAGRRAASRYVAGWSSSVSSSSSSAHRRLFERPPEEHLGKNGAAAGEREELEASSDAVTVPRGPGVTAALLASSPSGGRG